MNKILKRYFHATMLLIITSRSFPAMEQLSINGQLRTRTELHDGLGTLILKNNKPAFFISPRSRLTFNFKTSRVIFQTSLQDVRVWGQDASAISNDGVQMVVHEAWAEIILSDKKDTYFQRSPADFFAIKIGRQELKYDDSRLPGNLDWQQQARHHDAIVCKSLNKG